MILNHSDWLIKTFQPIRMLKASVAVKYRYRIGKSGQTTADDTVQTESSYRQQLSYGQKGSSTKRTN